MHALSYRHRRPLSRALPSNRRGLDWSRSALPHADHATLPFPGPIGTPGAGKYAARESPWALDFGKAASALITRLNWPASKPWKSFSMDYHSRSVRNLVSDSPAQLNRPRPTSGTTQTSRTLP